MLRVEVGALDDGEPGRYLALFDDLPEFVGHGDDEDEAVVDLIEQLMRVVLH